MQNSITISSAGEKRVSELKETLNQLIEAKPNCRSQLKNINEIRGLLEVHWLTYEGMKQGKEAVESAWSQITGLNLFEHTCDDFPFLIRGASIENYDEIYSSILRVLRFFPDAPKDVLEFIHEVGTLNWQFNYLCERAHEGDLDIKDFRSRILFLAQGRA